MTLGEKLTKLRRENNYTQEELADILGVSRQSVGKWESDLAYPETAKLVKLGELYRCSMDYLLKDEIDDETHSFTKDEGENEQGKKSAPLSFSLSLDFKNLYFERKSKTMIGKLPLWHINIGLGRTATGIFAFGLMAKGIVSFGLCSLGILSFGVFSLGIFAFGALALGLFSAGAIAAGIIAFGAIAAGFLAVGAIAIGEFSVGALSIGNYLAVGDHAKAAVAIGKTKAVGTLFSAHALTAEVRHTIVDLLDQTVPPIFAWIKALIQLFL